MSMTNIRPHSAVMAGTNANPNALRDIKPPIEIPSGWAWVGWVLLVLAVAALAFLAWRHWQKRRALGKIVPAVPAHIRAKQTLRDALRLIGQPRQFCILVSDVIRWYLEERFDFHAPERTTEEFLHELQGTNLLTPDQKTSLSEFLQRCDLVKFAKYEPGPPELHELHDSAMRLVEETEPIMAALEAVRVHGSVDGQVAAGPQMASGPITPPAVVAPVVRPTVNKGKRFAIIGIALQLAPCIPVLAYFTVLISVFSQVFGARDPGQATAAIGTLAGGMIGVVILVVLCLVAAMAGLALFVFALTKHRYRGEWFFWFLMVYSVLILGAFPIGTAAAIFFFVYCITRRGEFLKPREAAADL
jgi:hypothetical protein